MDDHTPQPGSLAALLAAERELLREQLAAAWQLQSQALLERLESGWRNLSEGAIERRFAGLDERLSQQLEQLASAKAASHGERVRAGVRQELSSLLSQTVRRIEQAGDAAAWSAALLDGAQAFAPQSILVELTGDTARVAAARTGAESAQEWSAPKPWPSLIHSCADAQDTVVALASAAELGAPLAALLQAGPLSRAVAVPVVAGRAGSKRRVAAVLIGVGEGAGVEASGLELLATIAGTALDCRLSAQSAATAAPAGALMGIAAPAPPSQPVQPSQAEPTPWREEELQARAQRFARVKVAEMRLYLPEAVLAGRAARDIYAALQQEIDRARDEYQQQFGSIASPVDYFHEEMVRTLAHDDASLLGPGYPGPRA